MFDMKTLFLSCNSHFTVPQAHGPEQSRAFDPERGRGVEGRDTSDEEPSRKSATAELFVLCRCGGWYLRTLLEIVRDHGAEEEKSCRIVDPQQEEDHLQ